jgi:hypothetical protein
MKSVVVLFFFDELLCEFFAVLENSLSMNFVPVVRSDRQEGRKEKREKESRREKQIDGRRGE